MSNNEYILLLFSYNESPGKWFPGDLKTSQKLKEKNTMKTYRLAMTAILASLLFVSAPVFASGTDDSIEASAKQSYVFKTYLKGDDITVKSKDGVVTLTGTVAEGSHKTLAQEYIAGLPGVKTVDNNLKEKGEVPAEHSDAWLITKVKATLLFHSNVKATETEVLAKDGTVTLRGNASSTAQKDLTTEYAKDVEGVKNVINEMKVPTSAIKTGETKMSEKMDAVSEKIDDASVTALVKSTLLYHRSTSALKTTVETKDGTVNLGGTAKNAAEKDLATKLVSDVHGVNKVVNNMTVK
jgi:hyperosmotically inducible periplasmic protein